jgi:hypothetical protein
MTPMFSDQELARIGPQNPQDAARSLRRRLDQRWVNLWITIAHITDRNAYRETTGAFHELHDTRWAEWVERYDTFLASSNPEQLKHTLQQGASLLDQFDVKHKVALDSSSSTSAIRIDAKAFTANITEAVDGALSKGARTLEDLGARMDKALTEFANVKRETLATGAFFDYLKKREADARGSADWFLRLSVVCLLLIPVAHVVVARFVRGSIILDLGSASRLKAGEVTEALQRVSSESSLENWLLRLAVTLPLAVLAFIFFGQYKVHRLEHFRYAHLIGFTSGGARELEGLLTSEKDGGAFRTELHRRLVDAFLSTEELTSAAKNARHPAGAMVSQLREARRLLSEVRAIAKDEPRGR